MQLDKSTIFTTSISFDESASLKFTPDASAITSLVVEVMRDTVGLINSIPKVLHHVLKVIYVTFVALTREIFRPVRNEVSNRSWSSSITTICGQLRTAYK